jgi:hypothetical protein
MSARSEEKMFTINYPWVFAQTRMYPANFANAKNVPPAEENKKRFPLIQK